jgi:hypothetical protein
MSNSAGNVRDYATLFLKTEPRTPPEALSPKQLKLANHHSVAATVCCRESKAVGKADIRLFSPLIRSGTANHFTASSLRFTSAGLSQTLHGLAHRNKRGRARADVRRIDADVRRIDNGDNLRRRDVNRGPVWPGERDDKTKHSCDNRRHILTPLACLQADDRWHQLLLRILSRL